MNTETLIQEILDGKIFIYPTDTLYGIGCDATNQQAVDKIKDIKVRDREKPLSIIAPSIEWIEQNCIVDVDINKYLPGAYTLILKKKNKDFLSWVSNNDSLGIRIPDNDFCRQVQKSGVPFITTTVNLAGEPFAINTNDISQEIKKQVDHIIDIGELSGRPSTLVIDGKEIKR